MFKLKSLQLSLMVIFAISLFGCDSHPTPKSKYINKSYEHFTIAEVEWDEIPLQQVIANHYQIATNKNQKVFIQITAEWCSPCKRLRKQTDDPQMMDAYGGTYIIRLDRDEWEKDFAEIGIKKTPIPIFWELGESLNPVTVTNYSLNGNYWKDISPTSLSPILKSYFSGRARQLLTKNHSKTNDL